MSRRLLFGLFATVIVVVGIALFLAAQQPAIAPIGPPQPSSFAPELVNKGEVLASAGLCVSCHTTRDGARGAGGVELWTPFGTFHSTNITPDPETGIGRWSEAAFTRALREGIARDGKHLFPIFPFDHFTNLTDADIKALYAYFMSLPAVSARAKPNTVPFPLDIRALLAAWKLVYFKKGPFRPDPSRSAQWNRGAYLVEGIAHCGSCHTPRNALGAEQAGHPYAGSLLDGWWATPLDISPSPVRWTGAEFVTFLRNGSSPSHGVAFGPMRPVIDGLGKLPPSDIEAIAAYFLDFNHTIMSDPKAVAARVSAPLPPVKGKDLPKADLYMHHCGDCHEKAGTTPAAAQSPLILSSSLWNEKEHNFIRVVLDGIGPAPGRSEPIMPGFRDTLTDEEIGDIGDYLRGPRAGLPLWYELWVTVRAMRADPLSTR